MMDRDTTSRQYNVVLPSQNRNLFLILRLTRSQEFWGTKDHGNKDKISLNHFMDQKAENKFGSNLGNKGT